MAKMDVTHIWRRVFDALSDALKVKVVDTALAIELDHADGDSVESHPAKLIASSLGVASPADDSTEIIPPLDCSSLRELRVDIDGSGSVSILVSPVDSGSFFYSIGGAGSTLPVCARRVKVVSVNANGDVHLVGRS